MAATRPVVIDTSNTQGASRRSRSGLAASAISLRCSALNVWVSARGRSMASMTARVERVAVAGWDVGHVENLSPLNAKPGAVWRPSSRALGVRSHDETA
jgi:hypothetical protein